ncbi:HAD family hydrolase [Pseudoalteromonas neustonica]|uniref:phosphoglycolate phosphatase n=1 Tax=Pseudoalteromonas neustonica TaxID=1840331 RepID=A0ABY3FEA0_9GAMM|nr:HAD hydrolase-like protein [Pseudoalteromonas neustonica]TVU83837.1 HAD family hydrolase [Pseudoalteromonas neustonica]
MRQIYNYDVYIFDCDGVILDSNKLKIDAMQRALESSISDLDKVKACVAYFRNNFGRSRFHHIDVFIEQFLELDKATENKVKKNILEEYSSQCKSLYLQADITPGFINFINQLSGKKYIASGSEQQELREVFKERELDIYFDEIYGSPIKKSNLVANILKAESSNNAVMFGDAISDLEASEINDIDFIAYIAFSNVPVELTKRSRLFGFNVINNWSDLYGEKI